MDQTSTNPEEQSQYFVKKVLDENSIRESERNLLGFFKVLMEIDQDQSSH